MRDEFKFLGLIILAMSGRVFENVSAVGGSSLDGGGDSDFMKDIDEYEKDEIFESDLEEGNSADLFPEYSDEKAEWKLNRKKHENDHLDSSKGNIVNSEFSGVSERRELTSVEKEKASELLPSANGTGTNSSGEASPKPPKHDAETPITRRQISTLQGTSEFIEPGTVPWSWGSFQDQGDDPYRPHYFQSNRYTTGPPKPKNHFYEEENEAVVEIEHGLEPAQYMQNNYYNLYFGDSSRNPTLSISDFNTPGKADKRKNEALLKALSQVYEKLSEPVDSGAVEEPIASGHPQLLGPMFYVHNSGEASSANIYGRGSKTIQKPISVPKQTTTSMPETDWKNVFFSQSNNEVTDAVTESQMIELTNEEEESIFQSHTMGQWHSSVQTTADTFRVPEIESTTTERYSQPYIFTYNRGPQWRTRAELQHADSATQTTTTTQHPSVMLRSEPEPVTDEEVPTGGADVDCNDKTLPCPDTVNVTYPLNGYCNRYVTCESGRAIRRVCSDGLHYNLITKSCDLPHNSICTYACPEPNGVYGIPGDCGGYFVCKNSVLEYRMCPPKMHWDIQREKCIFEALSTCPMKCESPNQVSSYEGDCKGYVVCLRGTPYYHKCPQNMKFDATTQTCVSEHVSQCRDNPKLLLKTLNPNVLCNNIMKKLGTKSWCEKFAANKSAMTPKDE